MAVLAQERSMPQLLVQKFGGTSMADHARIKAAAAKIAAERKRGHLVAAVVSAKAGETDRLLAECRAFGREPDPQEQDAILSTGETQTAGLLALALQAEGLAARSWQAWQLPLSTTGAHGRARITDLATEGLHERLAAGEVAIVAGFQGLAPTGRVTTLGRGGSDTSAVALAAALGAARCDIYTDVDGVYTCDPRLVPKARRIPRLSYEEMLEMASLGAKVLHTRSVEIGMKHAVPIQVLSSFAEPIGSDGQGTLITPEDKGMENQWISGIAYSRDDARITLLRIKDRPGVLASIFGPLAAAGINVDMIVQGIASADGYTDLTFTLPRGNRAEALAILNTHQADIGFATLVESGGVAKVSVIGVGMRSHAGVAQLMFKVLAEKGIQVHAIATSEIKISVLMDEDYMELALRALHTAYGLDAE